LRLFGPRNARPRARQRRPRPNRLLPAWAGRDLLPRMGCPCRLTSSVRGGKTGVRNSPKGWACP
jgi:hypothetical protein